ncbi:MAG: hypothetical protein ABI960_04855 [Candidatus Eisenbacteria bacterium]
MFTIARNGRFIAALVPYDRVALLDGLEDQADLAAARVAVAEGGGAGRVDWEWLKDYMGLE